MANEETFELPEHLAVQVVKKSNQPQLNIPHASVLAMLRLAGATAPGKGEPVKLGSPAKGKDHLLIECITKDGKTYRLVQGDTHALWLTHQDGDGLTRLEGLFSKLDIGQRGLLRVVKTTLIKSGDTSADDGSFVEVE